MNSRPAPSSASPRVVAVTVVSAEECHYCKRVRRILEHLELNYPMTIKYIGMSTPIGSDLIAGHRVPFPPLLLLDDEYFGHGRISEKKLERHLRSMGV